jgi:phosphatidylinositol glycan class H protein
MTSFAITTYDSPSFISTKMLTTAPYLHTRRPSPTTVEYTVSTHPPSTLSLRILLISTLLLRVLLGLSSLLLLHSAWQLNSYSSPLHSSTIAPPVFTNEFIWHIVAIIHFSPLGQLSTRLATSIPALVLVGGCILTLYSIFLRLHTSESLLVLRGLGIQTSTSSTTYLSTAATRFIPTEKIQDIFINEAFRGFEVRYYLVVVVEGEDEVVVVFPRLLPRRRIVESVWRGARECLYEPEKGERKDSLKEEGEAREKDGEKG